MDAVLFELYFSNALPELDRPSIALHSHYNSVCSTVPDARETPDVAAGICHDCGALGVLRTSSLPLNWSVLRPRLVFVGVAKASGIVTGVVQKLACERAL